MLLTAGTSIAYHFKPKNKRWVYAQWTNGVGESRGLVKDAGEMRERRPEAK